MGEGGREGGSTQQQQPDVGPLCGCEYGDISLYLLGGIVLQYTLHTSGSEGSEDR